MYGSPDKIAKLEDLAKRRQQAAWPGYSNIADFNGGIYESVHVSPYTRGSGNVDSSIFLLLQDWCSADFLNGLTPSQRETLAAIGRAPWLPTNRNLTALLTERLGTTLEECYTTNVMPFIKAGDMSKRIRSGDLQRAAKEFAIPQIRIVRPKRVICLGTQVFRSVRQALGLSPALGNGSQVRKFFVWEGISFWCQVHPGGLGCVSRGGLQVLHADWTAMVEHASSAS